MPDIITWPNELEALEQLLHDDNIGEMPLATAKKVTYLLQIAEMHLASGCADQALLMFDEAVNNAILQEHGLNPLYDAMGRCLHTLALMHLRRGYVDEANRIFLRATAYMSIERRTLALFMWVTWHMPTPRAWWRQLAS